VLRNGPSPDAAARFINFLLGSAGRKVMQEHGLAAVKPSVIGDVSQVPAPIATLIDSEK
jgi:ABC-type Fe3+ transport system substrate-binding protein